ncbi:MAG: hypothetical protein ACPL06_00060 [Candidatus Anstonellales archaeon]
MGLVSIEFMLDFLIMLTVIVILLSTAVYFQMASEKALQIAILKAESENRARLIDSFILSGNIDGIYAQDELFGESFIVEGGKVYTFRNGTRVEIPTIVKGVWNVEPV